MVLIIDNGGHTIKVGLSTQPAEAGRIIPNAVVRSKGDKKQYIGSQFTQCKDYTSLNWRLPLDKGYLTDWDVQKAVWDDAISQKVLNVDPVETSLLITEPPFNLSSIQEKYDQLVFEEYEFDSYYRATPASLAPYGSIFHTANEPELPMPQCSLIVDSGFSFTHIIPVMNGAPVWSSVKRIDLGGKLLTNHLAQSVSFRQWNMLDQIYIVNDIKETCCYVAQTRGQFRLDLETCRAFPKRNSIVQEYLLPDFSINRRGRLRTSDDILTDTDQLLYMENERFSVPEILFRPSDIGMNQAGLAETIANSISSLPNELQGMFWDNIGLMGGNTLLPGFEQRLLGELRPLAPADCDVSIYKDENPILTAFVGAHALSLSPQYPSMVLTHAEYKEGGSNAAFRKFHDWKPPPTGPAPIERRRGAPVVVEESEEDEPAPSSPARGKRRGRGRWGKRSASVVVKEDSSPVRGKGRGAKAGRGRGRGKTAT